MTRTHAVYVGAVVSVVGEVADEVAGWGRRSPATGKCSVIADTTKRKNKLK